MSQASQGAPSLLMLAEDAFVKHSGIARYQTELITQLAGRVNLHALVWDPLIVKAAPGSLPEPLRKVALEHCTAPATILSNAGRISRGLLSQPDLFDYNPMIFLNVISARLFSGAYIDRAGFDLVHGTSSYLPLTRGKTVRVVTVHDTTPLTMPERHIRNTVKCFVRPHEIRRTDQVIADTRSGLEEVLAVIDHPRENAHVIHLGIDRSLFRPTDGGRLAAAAPYLLSVGTIEPRKNLVRMLAAFERVSKAHDDLRWKVAGKAAWGWAEFSKALERSAVGSRVDVLGAVPDAQLAELYRGARAVVFPSLWEGFGFPVVEAMACGAPVAASRLPALEEVGAGAFVPLDPNDVGSIAEAVERAAFDEQGRAARREAGLEQSRKFDWAATADATLGVYAKALGREKEDLLLSPANP